MAPNIYVERPVEETLIPPVMITRNDNGHGTHRVVSTYAKKEEPEGNLPRLSGPIQAPSETPKSIPEDHLKGDQEHRQERPYRVSKTQEPQRIGKMIRQPSSSFLKGAIEEGEPSSDETSEEEQASKFANEQFPIHSKDADIYGEFPLFLQGRLPSPPVRTSDITPSSGSIAPFAVEDRRAAQLPHLASNSYNKRVLKPQESSPVTFNYEPKLPRQADESFAQNSPPNNPQHPLPSVSPAVTTYRPSSRLNHRRAQNHNTNGDNNNNNNNNNNDNNNNNNNNILFTNPEPMETTSPSDSKPSKTLRGTQTTSSSGPKPPSPPNNLRATQPPSPTTTDASSPVIVREILIESGPSSQAELKHIQEELADFSNLFHHQKSLDELALGGRDVAVRGDGWLLSTEGSTAAILGSMCSLIIMLICSIFLLKKWRTQALGNQKGGQKQKHVEAGEKHDFHKPLQNPDLHIPASFIPHLSFLYQLAHHHSTAKLDATVSSLIDVQEDMSEARLGRLWFSVRFNEEKSDLHVNILHARYPNGRDVGTNPGELWVEGIVLSPLNTVKATCKTSTRRATPSPVFNHSFLFLLQEKEVKSDILKLSLHDLHPRKGEETVGSIILPLSSVDLRSDEVYCRDLL